MSKYINVMISDGGATQLIADVDIEVTGEKEAIHISDLIYKAVLEKTKTQDQAVLVPGSYTVRLLATIVGD